MWIWNDGGIFFSSQFSSIKISEKKRSLDIVAKWATQFLTSSPCSRSTSGQNFDWLSRWHCSFKWEHRLTICNAVSNRGQGAKHMSSSRSMASFSSKNIVQQFWRSHVYIVFSLPVTKIISWRAEFCGLETCLANCSGRGESVLETNVNLIDSFLFWRTDLVWEGVTPEFRNDTWLEVDTKVKLWTCFSQRLATSGQNTRFHTWVVTSSQVAFLNSGVSIIKNRMNRRCWLRGKTDPAVLELAMITNFFFWETGIWTTYTFCHLKKEIEATHPRLLIGPHYSQRGKEICVKLKVDACWQTLPFVPNDTFYFYFSLGVFRKNKHAMEWGFILFSWGENSYREGQANEHRSLSGEHSLWT